jgi:hypothetical protein
MMEDKLEAYARRSGAPPVGREGEMTKSQYSSLDAMLFGFQLIFFEGI